MKNGVVAQKGDKSCAFDFDSKHRRGLQPERPFCRSGDLQVAAIGIAGLAKIPAIVGQYPETRKQTKDYSFPA
jgi:hypothetical protein